MGSLAFTFVFFAATAFASSALSPTALLNSLQSPVESSRLEAFKTLQIPTVPNWSPVSNTLLLFGHYREDGDLAILAVQTEKYVWSSVMLLTPTGWRSIGHFNCWCKYEDEPLSNFAEFRSLLRKGKTELLIHDSGGGSGIKGRTLRIYRVVKETLEPIFETSDMVNDCHPTQNKNYCTLTEEKLTYTLLEDNPAILIARVESREAAFPYDEVNHLSPSPPLATMSGLHRIGCKVLLWNETKSKFLNSQKWTETYCAPATPQPLFPKPQ